MKESHLLVFTMIAITALSSCSNMNQFFADSNRSPASVSKKIPVNESAVKESLQYIRDAAGLAAGSTPAQMQDVMLKTLTQAYILGDLLMVELDRKFDQGYTLEQLSKPKKGERNLYAEMMALRTLKEQVEDAIKGAGVLSFNESLDLGSAEVTWISQWRIQASALADSHAEKSPIIEVALHDVNAFLNELQVFYREGSFSATESLHSNPILSKIRAIRQAGKGSTLDSLKEFTSQEGEAGINVHHWIVGNVDLYGDELAKNFSTGRMPAQSTLKLFPSLGQTGSITGNGFPKGTWALTYDDGPAKTTSTVLSNLKKHDMKATFFMLSQQIDSAKKFPRVALDEVSEGHATASHSYSHPQVNKLGAVAREREIEGAAKMYAKVLGKRPDFFRLPYGAGVSVKAVREDMVKSCMLHVFWNVDTLDWHDKDPDSIYRRAVKQIEQLGRGIILFHDIHPQSVAASEKLMGYLKEKSIRMVTIPEIVKEINGGKEWSCKLGW
jgi:hypothetical protein